MRRLVLVLATIGVAVLLASGAALGITNGDPDNGRHPYVGALVEFPKEGKPGEPYPYCTGTLISPTIFLTAAHCGDKLVEAVEVTFEPDFDPLPTRSNTYDGTFYADPDGYDIAVVKFSEPISGIPTANLPSFHQFDHVAKGQKFTAVGYGGQVPVKQPGGPVIEYNDERKYAVSTYKSANQTYLNLSQNLNQDNNGGTCYGDSGGPNFLGEFPYPNNVPTIAGITITGDTWCKSTNVTLRLDIKPVRDFLRAQGVLQVTQCSDGRDNDNDDKIDFGRRGDPDCASETDDSESS